MAYNQRRGRGGGGQRSPEAPVPCPQCGGPMWDNSLTKTNPRAPDYQCKDSNCVDPESGYRTAVWATDTQKNAAQGTAAAKGQPTGQRMLIIDSCMEQCLIAAKTLFKEQLGGMDGQQTNIINIATTMFIGRTRDRTGILKVEKEGLAAARAKAKAAEDQRRREEQEATRTREQQDQAGWDQNPGPDDDLPF